MNKINPDIPRNIIKEPTVDWIKMTETKVDDVLIKLLKNHFSNKS